MPDVKPRASGPLWASANTLSLDTAHGDKIFDHDIPCRLIPGHGRVVPLELVSAIMDRYEALLRHYGDQWLDVEPVAEVSDAIDTALGGAM